MRTATPSPSIERLGLAALAVLTLAPIVAQAGWPWLRSLPGVAGDALHLTYAALVVAGGAGLMPGIAKKHKGFSSLLVAALLALAAAGFLGQDFPSKLAVAVALLGVAAFVAGLITWLGAHLPADVDGLAQAHKIQTGLFVVLAAFTIGQTARLSTFMGDATRADLSMLPDVVFFVDHSCLTAYVEALHLAEAGVANLYDVAHWPDEAQIAAGRAVVIPTTGPYAPFYLDGYMYPPQFLLLPAVLFGFTDNFLVQRALWFGWSGLWLAMGFGVVALWVSAQGHRRALWLTPLLWSSAIVLVTLQIGNVHHVVIVMAVLGMLAFEHQRPALGGALLAFAIVAKISPIFLGVVLLAQRRWREAVWTLAFGLIYTALALWWFGPQPLLSFLTYELPRLASGAAMGWAFSDLANIVVNISPFAIPLKLAALGVPIENVLGLARLVNQGYTLGLLGLTVFFALQTRTRVQKLMLWLGVLTLSGLQSPFAPSYVAMPIFWILTLLAAETKTVRGGMTLGILWAVLTLPSAIDNVSGVVTSLLQQGLLFGLLIFVLGRSATPTALGPQPVASAMAPD